MLMGESKPTCKVWRRESDQTMGTEGSIGSQAVVKREEGLGQPPLSSVSQSHPRAPPRCLWVSDGPFFLSFNLQIKQLTSVSSQHLNDHPIQGSQKLE